jgi:hypothetical protein
VNVAPFAVRQFWSTPQDFELWWEDPRDVERVVVQFGPGVAPQEAISLAYWRQSWPKVRVPKGALVGAGESGWLANDDWTNGTWQPADSEAARSGDAWTVTFHPLNRVEFPQEQDFPAVFRRTLKLRLHFPTPGAQVQAVAAFSDSSWREAELAIEWKASAGGSLRWDGRLEAFNGEIVSVRRLAGLVNVQGLGWESTVEEDATAGVVARVRYAFNEDANSFDRTIITLRSPSLAGSLAGVSFYVDDALSSGPVYVRDLGLLVSAAAANVRLADYEASWQAGRAPNLYQRIADLPEQTWEQAWANMPPKRSRMYYTLGGEGSRQKFRVDPEGDVRLYENYIRRAPGRDTPRLGWQGSELRFSFGFPAVEPGYRAILEDYLPVIRTVWVKDGLCFEQEACAAWLSGSPQVERMQGDDPLVAMLRICLTNTTAQARTAALELRATIDGETVETLREQDGLVFSSAGPLRLLWDSNGAGSLSPAPDGLVYQVDLAPGQSHALFVKIPHLDLNQAAEIDALRALSYAVEKERVVSFWRARVAQGAQIRTPNETLNSFYRTHLMHMLVINDREPGSDRNVARCGGFHYGSFPDEGCMAIDDLDRRGYTREAERCLDLYVHYQGTVPLPGNFQTKDGVFYGGSGYEVAGYNRNHGWVLWALAQHYRYTRDRAWLERVAGALVKGCNWIIRERQATLHAGTIQYGFLPSGSLEDVTDYWTWLATNAYAYWGFQAAADVLAEIDHPDAERLGNEARAFGQNLRAGFFEACARSPVVRLSDGRWVPHFPSRQERRGRDFGWLREVLEGPVHLIYCGLVDPDESAAGWILEDYEDNLFLSKQYGYPPEDFERQWFHWGGFSNQSNLLLFPPIYLWRDQPKHYLRAYFNAFASAFFPDTMTLCEHALPTLDDWRGDHFKSSDEANSVSWLRFMFLNEQGQDLYVGQAIPRAWFEDGKTMQVERARTLFGEASLAIESRAATGWIVIRLDPPRRSPPRHIYVRVRHPQGRPPREVWVNGLPHADFDPDREMIRLAGTFVPLEIRVRY